MNVHSQRQRSWNPSVLLVLAMLATCAIYAPGLFGSFIFDDYPNIVANDAIHAESLNLATLGRAALSSPASEFKRPLASISFAANYWLGGLDPFWMKLTNLLIHLVNGTLVFLLTRRLTQMTAPTQQAGTVAVLVAAAWMLLPINLTAVLYVVQRMEALANVFVLAGLLCYVVGRQRMRSENGGLLLCIAGLVAGTSGGLLAKESAILLPLYALVTEWLLFGFRDHLARRDRGIILLFIVVLLAPLAVGLAWLLPSLLQESAWASRDFTLWTRLLSESRVVAGYLRWIMLPTPSALTFYHDDFIPSVGMLTPWTTLPASLLVLALGTLTWIWRTRYPLVSLGLAFFLGGHLLTGTILPLDLVYEHRNYFPSYGLLLAIVPVLASPAGGRLTVLRRAVLGALFVLWSGLTALTAHAWGEPLRLAQELVARNPDSPRSRYELGFTYLVYSQYRADSPFLDHARKHLKLASVLPRSSILPEHALILMTARLGEVSDLDPWLSLERKLRQRKPSADDLAGLAALASCASEGECDIPKEQMVRAFVAALSHPRPDSRLLSSYAGYAWNVLDERPLAIGLISEAVQTNPSEPAYLLMHARMLVESGDVGGAAHVMQRMQAMNRGGRLDEEIALLEEGLARRAGDQVD